MTDRSNSSVSTTEAIDAMRRRGIDDPENLISCTSAERIVETCNWWDGLNGVGKGLLVKRIREGGIAAVREQPVEGSGRAAMFARFDKAAAVFPIGAVTESHRRMSRRCWRHDECDCQGVMVVIETSFPHLSVRCDGCGFEAAYPLKSLPVLPPEPPIAPRAVPDARPQVPPEQHRTPGQQLRSSLHRFDPSLAKTTPPQEG